VPLVRPRRYEQQLTSEFLELKSHVRNLIHHEGTVATEFEGVLD
jgi:hypothetical protein